MTDETTKIREEIGRKGTAWAAQEIATLRRLVAVARLQVEGKPQRLDDASVGSTHRHG